MGKRLVCIGRNDNGYEHIYDKVSGIEKEVSPSWIAAPDASYHYNKALELSLPDKRIPTIRTILMSPQDCQITNEISEKTGKLLRKEHRFYSDVFGVKSKVWFFQETYNEKGMLSGRHFVVFADNRRIDMEVNYNGAHIDRQLFCDGEPVDDPNKIGALYSLDDEEKILKEASMQERFIKRTFNEIREESKEKGLLSKLKEKARKSFSKEDKTIVR